jgi:hypothetical protein
MSGQMSIRPRKVKQNRRNGVRYHDTFHSVPSPQRTLGSISGRWGSGQGQEMDASVRWQDER